MAESVSEWVAQTGELSENMPAPSDEMDLLEDFLRFARSGVSFAYPPGSLQRLERLVAKARGANN